VAATGTVSSATPRTRSAPTSTGRRGSRSTHTPAGRASTAKETVPAAVRTPTWSGEARSPSTATSGSAIDPTWEPSSLIACPATSRRTSRCRSSPPPRGDAGEEGTVAVMGQAFPSLGGAGNLPLGVRPCWRASHRTRDPRSDMTIKGADP
jgi:hypothetical protein